ncbi:MAG: DUF58 domain-containing protein [Clostridiales bacterium]|nr:DUF58 domain-containing protein [Clostridiales bacterium]
MKTFINDEFFSRLETLALNLKKELAGYFGGKHLVKTYGQTVEFADYREYQLGDDIRRIDWNLYSRFEKFFLKLFTDERQMHTQIFLDCSGSMGKENPDKAAYAIGVAAALGFLSVHNMDKVSFNLVKGERAENPYGTIVGKTSFFRVISDLNNLTFDDEVNVGEAILKCPNTGTNDGLTVIISDFLSETDTWKKAVDYLKYKRRQVLLLQILTPEEIDPIYNGRLDLIDSEATSLTDSKNLRIRITRSMQRAYEEALKDFTEDIKQFCRTREVDFVTLSTEKSIEKGLFGELFKVGIME